MPDPRLSPQCVRAAPMVSCGNASGQDRWAFLFCHRGDRRDPASRAAPPLHRGARRCPGGRHRNRAAADRGVPGADRSHRRSTSRRIRARHRRVTDRALGQRSQATSAEVANSPRSVNGERLTAPMSGNPDPAAVSGPPLAGDPDGVRVRRGGVPTGHPHPSVSAPAPISGLPNHGRPGRWRDHFLLGWWRSGRSAVSRTGVTRRLCGSGVGRRRVLLGGRPR